MLAVTAGFMVAWCALALPGRAVAQESSILESIRILESLENRTTHAKQWEAARWVAHRAETAGLKVEIREYEHDGRAWPNVTATLPGTEAPGELVLVIAHLDSISWERPEQAPGADDNGTGVAVLIDVARGLAARPRARTIQFAFFSNEERGHLGSKHFARTARASETKIVAVVNLDTVGYSKPASIFDWDGLAGIGSTLRAAGAFKTMIANQVRSYLGPDAGVRVVGRPANASLVKAVGESMRQHAHVEEVVREDCG